MYSHPHGVGLSEPNSLPNKLLYNFFFLFKYKLFLHWLCSPRRAGAPLLSSTCMYSTLLGKKNIDFSLILLAFRESPIGTHNIFIWFRFPLIYKIDLRSFHNTNSLVSDHYPFFLFPDKTP